ncbi:hypothetical protein pipiens_018641 [Culex pipiens pipiens]|uniref:Uncharacterized protein n=1 Tax=Culex pipiens pipiens TaxID=38569 RepID=A0ABD1CAU0_CULPP
MLRHERQPELRVGAEVLNDIKAASGIRMCEAIVDRPGQVSPNLHKVCDYNSNMVNLQEVLFEKHFDERFPCYQQFTVSTTPSWSPASKTDHPSSELEASNKDITSINSCDIRNEGSWYCLLESLHSQPSHCISPDFVHLNDESVPISHEIDGLIECCNAEIKASNCYEYMENINAEDVALPQHMCLNFRKVIENSFAYRHQQPTCPERHCFKPMINNFTTIMQIRRDRKPDVIYIGHPADLTRTIRISHQRLDKIMCQGPLGNSSGRKLGRNWRSFTLGFIIPHVDLVLRQRYFPLKRNARVLILEVVL